MSILIEKILEILQAQTEVTVSFIDSFIGDKYTSYRKMRNLLKYGPRQFETDWADAYRRRQRFYALLNYLKKEGLVDNKKSKGRLSIWSITKKGREWLSRLKKKRQDPFSLYGVEFSKPRGEGMTVVIFDIPEKERCKRDWVRNCLVIMGFKYLQKSVWVAKGKIDEKFIHALRKRRMLDYVHIFSVHRKGSIKLY